MHDAEQNRNRQTADVQDAVIFFAGADLSSLLILLRQKYIAKSGAIGSITIESSTSKEREYIGGLLNKRFSQGEALKISLTEMDVALRKSGFHCSLADLLTAFFPEQPLITKKQIQEQKIKQQEDFREQLEATAYSFPHDAKGRLWLTQGEYGLNWLFSRYKRTIDVDTSKQEQCLKIIHIVASAVSQLPVPGSNMRIAVFAQRINADPHTFDRNREEGRLLLYALADLVMLQDGEKHIPQDRVTIAYLYERVGLMTDTISSNIAIFKLAHAFYMNGICDPLIEAAGGRVLLLPLRQISDWKECEASEENIFVVENPQVFEELVDVLSPLEHAPTLLCTSGWPSAAAYKLLDQLVKHNHRLRIHYSGDFDLKGLQIAASLLKRYPHNCLPWCFEPEVYIYMLENSDGVEAATTELADLKKLPDIFTPLVTKIIEKRKWTYQEGIISVLAANLLGKDRGTERSDANVEL